MNTQSRAKMAVVAVGVFLFAHVYHVTVEFFDTHVLQSPIVIRKPYRDRYVSPLPADIKVTPLVTPVEKKKPTPTPIKKAHTFDLVRSVEASDTPSDQEIINYICSKDWDCQTAVAIAKSENFWNLTKSFDCGRMGKVNKNGTVDAGLWQINSIHINSGAITQADALDCFKATDFAYKLYRGRGNTFTAWYAFTNGSYKSHL